MSPAITTTTLPTLQNIQQQQQQQIRHYRPPNNNNRNMASLGALTTASIYLFGKTKYLLTALKLTKLSSLGSMLITVGTYSLFYGWPFSIGMVSLILIHESGHALVMKRLGIPFSPMIFVPFIGASVAMNRQPRDAWEEALIGMGGPALGSLGAAGVCALAMTSGSDLLFALADFGFMINLFNLLPIGFLDGGRICGALSPYAGVVGLGMGGLLIMGGMVHNPIFYVVMMAGTYQTFTRLYWPDHGVGRNYYRITPMQKGMITGGYFGLIGFLVAGMAVSGRFKKSPEQLQYERSLGVYHP